MNTSLHIPYLLLLTLCVVVLLLPLYSVLAQPTALEESIEANAATSSSQKKKVDTNKIKTLNAVSNAPITDPAETNANRAGRKSEQTVDAGTVPVPQQNNNKGGVNENANIGDTKSRWQNSGIGHAIVIKEVVATRANEVDFRDADSDDDVSDDDEARSPSHSISDTDITVSALEVRGWDPKTKEDVRGRLAEIDEVNSANDFGMWMASLALDDERILDMNSTPKQTKVLYKTQLRLFGFLPITTEVFAQVNEEAELQIDYPWYAFFSVKSDHGFITKLVLDIHTKRIAFE